MQDAEQRDFGSHHREEDGAAGGSGADPGHRGPERAVTLLGGLEKGRSGISGRLGGVWWLDFDSVSAYRRAAAVTTGRISANNLRAPAMCRGSLFIGSPPVFV
jgi:hypothetical protein